MKNLMEFSQFELEQTQEEAVVGGRRRGRSRRTRTTTTLSSFEGLSSFFGMCGGGLEVAEIEAAVEEVAAEIATLEPASAEAVAMLVEGEVNTIAIAQEYAVIRQ